MRTTSPEGASNIPSAGQHETVASGSGGPSVANTAEAPPSYDSSSFASAPPLPRADDDADDHLPTYEQVLTDLVERSEAGAH